MRTEGPIFGKVDEDAKRDILEYHPCTGWRLIDWAPNLTIAMKKLDAYRKFSKSDPTDWCIRKTGTV